jgi:hypothetical protein
VDLVAVILRCFSESELVPHVHGIDSTFFSAIFVVEEFLPVYCRNVFIVKVWVGLRGLLRFMPLPITQTALTGSQFSWRLCQEFIGLCHSFGKFFSLFSCYCTDLVILGLLLRCLALFWVLV